MPAVYITCNRNPPKIKLQIFFKDMEVSPKNGVNEPNGDAMLICDLHSFTLLLEVCPNL